MHTATEKKFFKNNVRNVTTLRTLRTIVNYMKKQQVIRWGYVSSLIASSENVTLFKNIEKGKWGLSPFFIFVNRVFLGLHDIPLCYPNSSI
ncbi:hypothetical protein C1N27_06900 [Vibrio diazotrophicus]|nr:hypothetical protein C1N27_06900 [Vibrio diazotrophicus]